MEAITLRELYELTNNPEIPGPSLEEFLNEKKDVIGQTVTILKGVHDWKSKELPTLSEKQYLITGL